MSNYPPGVSAGTPNAPWNTPDMSHDHEWCPMEDSPVLEDGAAIFREECVWENVQNSERGYEGERIVTESIPCEEVRHIRFEPSYVWYPNGNGVPFGTMWDGGQLPVNMEHALMKIETEWPKGNVDIVNIDPDPQDGEVRVEWNDWTFVYKPE